MHMISPSTRFTKITTTRTHRNYICQSTILNEELLITHNSKRNTDYFTKTLFFKPMFQINKYTIEQQKILTMLNFQHSRINEQEFEQLADLLLKYPMVYAISKLDVGKKHSPQHYPLKPDTIFKTQGASKILIHLLDKVNRLVTNLEEYEIISPVKREQESKKKHI